MQTATGNLWQEDSNIYSIYIVRCEVLDSLMSAVFLEVSFITWAHTVYEAVRGCIYGGEGEREREGWRGEGNIFCRSKRELW